MRYGCQEELAIPQPASNVPESVPVDVPLQDSGEDVPRNQALLDVLSRKVLLQHRGRHTLVTDKNIYARREYPKYAMNFAGHRKFLFQTGNLAFVP